MPPKMKKNNNKKISHLNAGAKYVEFVIWSILNSKNLIKLATPLPPKKLKLIKIPINFHGNIWHTYNLH